MIAKKKKSESSALAQFVASKWGQANTQPMKYFLMISTYRDYEQYLDKSQWPKAKSLVGSSFIHYLDKMRSGYDGCYRDVDAVDVRCLLPRMITITVTSS